MSVKKENFNKFKGDVRKDGLEGLVLLGAGGDLNDWIEGVTSDLQEEGILEAGRASDLWGGIIELKTTGGRTDLVMLFKEGVDYNLGKMAMWRIGYGDCSWVSDYIDNYEEQH